MSLSQPLVESRDHTRSTFQRRWIRLFPAMVLRLLLCQIPQKEPPKRALTKRHRPQLHALPPLQQPLQVQGTLNMMGQQNSQSFWYMLILNPISQEDVILLGSKSQPLLWPPTSKEYMTQILTKPA